MNWSVPIIINRKIFAGIPKGFGSWIPSPIAKPSYNGIVITAIKKPNIIHALKIAGKNV